MCTITIRVVNSDFETLVFKYLIALRTKLHDFAAMKHHKWSTTEEKWSWIQIENWMLIAELFEETEREWDKQK